MPPTPNAKEGLCLLSLDAGGRRSSSQLRILDAVMHSHSVSSQKEDANLPCATFDMIGGVGSGGFIAILLVIFGLTCQEALDLFVYFSTTVLDAPRMTPKARATALSDKVRRLLTKHGMEEDSRLLDTSKRSKGCKLIVPISYKSSVRAICILRNFSAPGYPSPDITIAEAILATLSSPPLFPPVSVFKDLLHFEYIGADLALSNPLTEVVTEAYGVYGPDTRVACLLSIGCGHPGITAISDHADTTMWKELLEKLAKDSEREAQMVEARMGHLGLYHRFSVTQELEAPTGVKNRSDFGSIFRYTNDYLREGEVAAKIEQCASRILQRIGSSTLEQLKHTGGEIVMPTSSALLTKSFVMRRIPWSFMEDTMLGPRSLASPQEQQIVTVTGIGGCGKTQLIVKFIKVHGNRFASCFWIDGSSETRIRADILQNIRALDVEHSQKTFRDCLAILDQPCPEGKRLLIYDNVDDVNLNLLPLLPSTANCAVIITSRNRSLGELHPVGHLELDVMSLEEAVELLLFTTDEQAARSEKDAVNAGQIAEALGCLPLALTQARSYMWQTKRSAESYLKILLSSRDKLLAQPVRNHQDLRYASTFAAFDASLEQVAPAGRRFLLLMSCLHWANFPVDLIVTAAENNFADYQGKYVEPGEELYASQKLLMLTFFRDGEWDVTNVDGLTVTLQNLSLINITTGIDTTLIHMHPLAHAWAFSKIPPEERLLYQSTAALLLVLGVRKEHLPSTQYLASHVSHLSPIWAMLHVNYRGAFADILHAAGLYSDVFTLREGVLDSLTSQLGSDHEAVVGASEGLSNSCVETGRLIHAEGLQREVLAWRTKAFGEEDPRTIWAENNLALTYRKRHLLKEAEELLAKIWQVRINTLGERAPDTLSAANNLAIVYRVQGRVEEAETLQLQVLQIRKETFAEKDPSIFNAASNLGVTYQNTGKLKEAEDLQRYVLDGRTELFGRRNPATIAASNNLGLTFYHSGRLKEAEEIQLAIIRLRTEVLGPRNPDTIAARNNLALTYGKQGRAQEAEKIQLEALKLREEIIGTDHPDTVREYLCLAQTYQQLGNKARAADFVREADEVITRDRGSAHAYYAWCQRLKAELVLSAHASETP